MQDFGQSLHNLQHQNPSQHYTLYKLDVASAFLNLPAHPIWQLQQIVVVDGRFYIVRRLVFGSRASPRIWCAVSGLLAWVAIRVLHIHDIFVYMDDFYGAERETDLVLFHGRYRPRSQVYLLLFWDAINCPYDDNKQCDGPELKIIGFWVNVNLGSISISPSSVADTILAIDQFISEPSRKHTLREWSRLAGWLNWVLNVFPWGRPAMTEMYRKMSGKLHMLAPVYLNREVVADLTWFKGVMPDAVGVLFVDSGRWTDSEADMIIHTDATLSFGLSFVYANIAHVYHIAPPPFGINKPDIFFFEELAILSAIHHAAQLLVPPRRILIFSDSLDCVHAFNSLHVSQSIHNAPLLAVASIILTSGVDVRVRHISGIDNVRADLLSRLMFNEYHIRYPADRVHFFNPPRDLLPVQWRQCF
ncbi:hypothetical protein BC835DRAFT_1277097 [Cytidiella melzeri]|nr:hypothetical protein BC835DRAFT_1277097 [Cytidiella melzeri]